MGLINFNNDAKLLLFMGMAFVLLLLSLLNIKNYFSRQNKSYHVLGAETQINPYENFWNNFLNKNPGYIPGWIETGRLDKVYFLNPNFLNKNQ